MPLEHVDISENIEITPPLWSTFVETIFTYSGHSIKYLYISDCLLKSESTDSIIVGI